MQPIPTKTSKVYLIETISPFGEEGGLLTFCSIECLREWGINSQLEDINDIEILIGEVKASYGSCMYCADCGFIIMPAMKCLLHSDICEGWSWSVRLNFMDEFLANIDGYEMNDDDWDIANKLMLKAPNLTAIELSNLIVVID